MQCRRQAVRSPRHVSGIVSAPPGFVGRPAEYYHARGTTNQGSRSGGIIRTHWVRITYNTIYKDDLSMKNFRNSAIFVILFSILAYAPAFSSSEEKGEPKPAEASPRYGGIYHRGLLNEPAVLDPAKITDNYEIIVTQQIFEGLVQYSDNLMVIPCLAESWESSRDNLAWKFHLKSDASFHNGRTVTADDVVYSFERLLDPGTKSVVANLMMCIKGAREFREGKTNNVEGLKAVGTHTVEIQLARAFPPFIAMLAMVNFGIVPREEVERPGFDFGHHPTGTGPYKFERWDRNREIVLTANKNYHEGRPYLDGVVFRIYPGMSMENMFSEFEKGNLEDSLFPAGERDRVIAQKIYQVVRRPSLSERFLVMNNGIKPFNDRRVRQAFNYAIDKDAISLEAGRGRLIPSTGLFPEGMAGYVPENINYPYAPDKARTLLAQAGYPNGKGLPVVQFWSSVKSKALLIEDREIERYLSEIGVSIELNYLTDWPSFKRMLEEGKAPMFKYSWEADVPDPDNIISSLFYSKSPTNRAFYRNQAVDSMIEKAQRESDYKKRIAMYTELQRIIMEDAPVIVLNTLAYERVFQPYVRNFKTKAIGDHSFSLKRVWLDKETAD